MYKRMEREKSGTHTPMAENNICLTGARPVPQAEAEDGSGLGAVVALPGVLWNNDTVCFCGLVDHHRTNLSFIR